MLLISKKGDYNLRRKKGGGERERERGGGIVIYKCTKWLQSNHAKHTECSDIWHKNGFCYKVEKHTKCDRDG